MRTDQRVSPLFLIGGVVVIVIILILLIRSCSAPSMEEQIAMTSTALATEAQLQTRVAALTAVVATQTQAAAPTATPPPQFICVERGHFMGIAAVLQPFDLAYDENITYEMCELERQDRDEICTRRTPLEKGEFGPIIPDVNIWIVIPGAGEEVCDSGNGRWVLDMSPYLQSPAEP
jgi:hypothetical protein